MKRRVKTWCKMKQIQRPPTACQVKLSDAKRFQYCSAGCGGRNTAAGVHVAEGIECEKKIQKPFSTCLAAQLESRNAELRSEARFFPRVPAKVTITVISVIQQQHQHRQVIVLSSSCKSTSSLSSSSAAASSWQLKVQRCKHMGWLNVTLYGDSASDGTGSCSETPVDIYHGQTSTQESWMLDDVGPFCYIKCLFMPVISLALYVLGRARALKLRARGWSRCCV